MRAASGICLMV